MQTESTRVIVSRKWAAHEITHTVVVDNDEVRIEADLHEFIIALAKEVGTTLQLGMFTRTVPQDVLQQKLLACLGVVISDMKQSTAK